MKSQLEPKWQSHWLTPHPPIQNTAHLFLFVSTVCFSNKSCHSQVHAHPPSWKQARTFCGLVAVMGPIPWAEIPVATAHRFYFKFLAKEDSIQLMRPFSGSNDSVALKPDLLAFCTTLCLLGYKSSELHFDISTCEVPST